MQILVRCDRPGMLASRLFQQDHVVEAKVSADGKGLLLRTKDADSDTIDVSGQLPDGRKFTIWSGDPSDNK